MKILDINGLNLGFECECGFRQALFDVSFSLDCGSIHALVGESGCGKTMSAMSILKLIPKQASVTSGTIMFENRNLLECSNREIQNIRGKKIALIPQDPMTALNPLYTIGAQLLEVLKIHQGLTGISARKKAVDALQAVQFPCAEERLNSYPHELSGGMKQRAIIAMALACNAEILIADEPTTALDVTIQAQIMELIKNIKDEHNTAVLLITHDLALVKEYADFVSVMYAGRIVEKASASDFFNNPMHPYSIALLNSIPENRVKKLKTICGQPPSIQQEIPGCRFHPRCNYTMDICREKIPVLQALKGNHCYACFKKGKGI